MENILILGSSLAKQVVQNIENSGQKINNILFKGKLNLTFLESTLKQRNTKFITVVYLAGNDLMPTKLHKLNNRTHVCLDTYCEKDCSRVYSRLVEILSNYTDRVIFVEPPPRAPYVVVSSKCSFYDNNTGQRFRNVINSLKSEIKSDINVGVFSNITLSGFLKKSNSRICAFDNTHFSKEALNVIHSQVIAKYL